MKRHKGVFELLQCRMGSIYMQGSWGSCYDWGGGGEHLFVAAIARLGLEIRV